MYKSKISWNDSFPPQVGKIFPMNMPISEI